MSIMARAEWVDYADKNESLQAVPEELIDRSFCLEVVTTCGVVLREVPDEFKDYELCLMAVRAGAGLLCVPEEHRTYEVCLEAARWFAHPNSIPKEFRTPEIKEAILSQIDVGDNTDFRSWE